MLIENENDNFAKPMLGAVASDIKDNKIMLLEEDLWCVHKYLDDLELPRTDKDGKEYSIVGRIKRLEEWVFERQMFGLYRMFHSSKSVQITTSSTFFAKQMLVAAVFIKIMLWASFVKPNK